MTIDFANDIPVGETISSVDYVYLWNVAGVDKTDEIRGAVPTAPTINGTNVIFWKEIALTDEQDVGRYEVECRVTLSNGEQPIALTQRKRLPQIEIVDDQ